MNKPLRVLTLQPFYGGSHRAFIDGWIKHSIHDWSIVSLPDSRWKTRMREGALEIANELRTLVEQGKEWDVVLSTDMLNFEEWLKLSLIHI